MTDTYKVLGQALTGELALDNSTVKETIAYEVPAGTKASVSAIEITNSDTATQTYKVAFVPDSDVDTAIKLIEYPESVMQNVFIATTTLASAAAYSTDGLIWNQISMPSGYEFEAIQYGNGKFVAFAYDVPVLVTAYSTDGITWTLTIEDTINFTPYLVAYGNNTFVGLRSPSGLIAGSAISSTDGITWTESIMPTYYWTQLAYGDGKFFALSSIAGVGAYSTDGITWTQTDLPALNISWRSMTYGSGKFVVVGDSGQSIYSTDGINWSISMMPSYQDWTQLTYGDGKFVALASTASVGAYSTDGITWTQTSIPGYAYNPFSGLVHANGKFVAVISRLIWPPQPSKAISSTDGIFWIESEMAYSDSWSSLSSGVVNQLQLFPQQIPQSLNKHIAIYNKTIAPGETHEIKGGITLSAGDQIRVYSDSAEIITNVYGVEIA